MAAAPEKTIVHCKLIVPTEKHEDGKEITSPSHDEWLLDEALVETFPASDPIAPST